VYPNIGSTCDLPANTECRYTCVNAVICDANGVWTRGMPNCPICNSPDTPIATPEGQRPVAELSEGDLVYSIHEGELAIVPVLRIGSMPQHDHHVVRVVLETGVTLEISPTHPTADGRRIGDLVATSTIDGVRVVSAQLVPYEHARTYDILPESDSGTYYAGGVLIGSTLRAPVLVSDAPAPFSSAFASSGSPLAP
jgi:hypothetical protein